MTQAQDGAAAARERRLHEAAASPRQIYGALFEDVQMQRVLVDGKNFVDAVPSHANPTTIVKSYLRDSKLPSFELLSFVKQHFRLPLELLPRGTHAGIQEHVRELWRTLLCRTAQQLSPWDSLLDLPHPYLAPGGRYREMYYWDSYFSAMGLALDGYRPAAAHILYNQAHLIDRFGCVPTANRRYLLGRSHPPLLYRLVLAVEGGSAPRAWSRWLPQLMTEHAFWMDGEQGLAEGDACRRVVNVGDGLILNRYWDDVEGPREESFYEDVVTARASPRPAQQVYRDLRAGAESGWELSSRWCHDPERLETIETTSILPVDLNALLWGLEVAIAQGAAATGRFDTLTEYARRAQNRRIAIDRWLWNESLRHYVDYQWYRGTSRPNLTAAALAPLFTGVASAAQADAMVRTVSARLLGCNGIATTENHTREQWDAPNGWAPMQWMAAIGFKNYGHHTVAREIASRWVACNQRVYLECGRLLETYNVLADPSEAGREYENQGRLSWTLGTYVALQKTFFGANTVE